MNKDDPVNLSGHFKPRPWKLQVDGLVHVSQISSERVEKVSDKLKEGDIVKVKVLEVDKQGRIRLSMKAVTEDEGNA